MSPQCPDPGQGCKTQGGALEEVFPILTLEQSCRQGGGCRPNGPSRGWHTEQPEEGQAVALGSTIINIADPISFTMKTVRAGAKEGCPCDLLL